MIQIASKFTTEAYRAYLRCELIFIDGGHSYDVAIRDLKNFAALANLKNNVLLLDDTFLDDVRRAWDEMMDMGYVEETFALIWLLDAFGFFRKGHTHW